MAKPSTYSIVACDLEAAEWGVAVQSKFLALDRDFQDAPPRCAEPALPHSSYVAPGAMSMISQLVVRASRQASGVPVRSGNVP